MSCVTDRCVQSTCVTLWADHARCVPWLGEVSGRHFAAESPFVMVVTWM